MLVSEGMDRNGGRVHMEVSVEATTDLTFEVLLVELSPWNTL